MFNHLVILIIGLVFMSTANAGVPAEVVALENAFKSVPGTIEVNVGKHQYSKKEIEMLTETYFTGQFADLPIAMLKRSEGNLENELLIVVEFRIEKNERGLKALEFLSWWVRDLSRSGDNVQIRSIGLPPEAGDTIQLGHTLRFWFEAYIVTKEPDMSLVLAQMEKFASSLNNGFSSYKKAFKE